MSQTPNPQLREVIYSRIAESNGCYLLVYSGPGEKLSFLSVFLKGMRTKVARKLLIDLGLRHYIDEFNVKGTTVIGSLSEIAQKDSFESFFPRYLGGEIEKLAGARRGGDGAAPVVIAVDMSSFSIEWRKSNEQEIYSFHKGMVDLIHSLRGVTAILLYDADSLSESLMSRLVSLHVTSDHPLNKFSNPKALKDESKVKADAGCLSPEIVALRGGILFFEPPSKSAAVLVPNTDAIKEVLPSDPLNAAHRDLAFENNYTAYERACPYFSSEVPSGCLLDPNVISAMSLRGRSFIEGHPCITAIDHSLLEEKPKKNEDRDGEGDPNHYDDDKATGFTTGINDTVRVEDCNSHVETWPKDNKGKGAPESGRMKNVYQTLG